MIFDSPKATAGHINKTAKALNPRKTTGLDGVPIRIIKNMIEAKFIIIDL